MIVVIVVINAFDHRSQFYKDLYFLLNNIWRICMILERTQINNSISHWVDICKDNINEGHPGVAFCTKDTAMKKEKKDKTLVLLLY